MYQKSKYKYADLPVFRYQVYDQATLKFSDVPIIPPREKPPLVDEELADNYWKEVTADSPKDTGTAEEGGDGDAGPSSSNEQAEAAGPVEEELSKGKFLSK